MKIIAFTGNRADYYLQLPLLRKINSEKVFELRLIVSGGILGEFDKTVINDMNKEGFIIGAKIFINEFPNNHSYVIPKVIIESSKFIEVYKPDLCIVYADRYESFGFSIASFHSNIPSLHLEAGDITNGGTYDDNLRHCITKMSHLFCTSTKRGLDIIQNLGEESWRGIHSGLISYDDMKKKNKTDQEKVIEELQLTSHPIILCTMHPIPNKINDSLKDTAQLFEALKEISFKNKLNIIVTAPNNDSGSKLITEIITKQTKLVKGGKFINTLGGYRFQSILSLASKRPVIVCGNSSSIIKEAPYFNAHGLNIGDRQSGRDRADSQIDVEGDSLKIMNILQKMIKTKCTVNNNPYYVENSSEVIIDFIKKIFSSKSKSEILNKRWNEK